MTQHDVTELAGLFTGVLGFGLALYGLLLIADVAAVHRRWVVSGCLWSRHRCAGESRWRVTLLRGLFEQEDRGFQPTSAPTSLTVRDNIVTSNSHALLNMWGSIALAGDYTAFTKRSSGRSSGFRIAVNKIAHAIGYLPLKVYERGEGNRRERTTGSSLAQLFESRTIRS